MAGAVEALYECAPCGLLVTDDDGLILRANRTFCDWLGVGREALVGKRRFQDLLTIGGRIFHQTQWSPLLRMQGSVAEVKLELARGEGAPLPMMMNAVRREHDGTCVHELALFIARDRHAYERELLGARKRAEELLAEQQAAREELALAESRLRGALAELGAERAAAEDRALFAEQMVGIVSHDLRNPLSTIRMGADVLDMLGGPDRQRQVLGNITRATARALRLINDLLDFTRARLGQGLLVVRERIDVHAVVRAQVEELSQAHPDARIVHVARGEGDCIADPDRLSQLVGNLVSNAVAYGRAGTPITVATVAGADDFTISVQNQGDPIPGAIRASLFQPMVRGTTAGAEGRSVGLGLYIVSEVARAHGGTVCAESVPGEGTTFMATMPRTPDA